MSNQASLNGYVVSDLHVFSVVSTYERLAPTLYDGIRNASVLVLNGDTFDFKRSKYSSSKETAHHAAQWVEDLCVQFPHKQVHYVLGNHDCHYLFVEALHRLEAQHENLRVSEDILVINNSLFMHGDAIDLPSDSIDLTARRLRYAQVEPSASSKMCAQVVTRTRLNLVDHLRHTRSDLARSLLRYLGKRHAKSLASTKQVYFGHTHIPFHAFEYEGKLFYNTGSMVRGLTWMPATFTA
jgi:UDP-2,3-diacylglucosamine pyrophosphatase LpxH